MCVKSLLFSYHPSHQHQYQHILYYVCNNKHYYNLIIFDIPAGILIRLWRGHDTLNSGYYRIYYCSCYCLTFPFYFMWCSGRCDRQDRKYQPLIIMAHSLHAVWGLNTCRMWEVNAGGKFIREVLKKWWGYAYGILTYMRG